MQNNAPEPTKFANGIRKSFSFTVFEYLVSIPLFTMLIAYGTYDESMKVLVRAYLVFSIYTYLIGSLHVVLVARNRWNPIHPGWLTVMILLRAFGVVALIAWGMNSDLF